MGQANHYLTPHPLYLACGEDAKARIRLALNQNQPLGKAHFYAKIEAMTGRRRDPKPRGRPKKQAEDRAAQDMEQGELPL